MKPAVPQSIDFEFPPEVGTVMMSRGQRYEVNDLRAHTRQDGSETTLIVWISHCARCGEPFEFASPLKSKWPNRRCTECASPGRRA